MPLIFNSEIANQKVKLGIWELQESVDALLLLASLSKNDEERFCELRHESRKKQWLASRIILQELSGNPKLSVSYEKTGRPIINDGIHHVSISHTVNFVSVILGKSTKVGIDIEYIHPRILKVAHKFVSQAEENFLKNHKNLQESLVLIWSAKEALFKLNGKTDMDFRKNILIKPFDIQDDGVLFGIVQKENISHEHKLYYKRIADHMLVYAMTAI
jgi:4'-phosphopantetheinyl transferase